MKWHVSTGQRFRPGCPDVRDAAYKLTLTAERPGDNAETRLLARLATAVYDLGLAEVVRRVESEGCAP